MASVARAVNVSRVYQLPETGLRCAMRLRGITRVLAEPDVEAHQKEPQVCNGADEPVRVRARQPRTYAAHLHEEAAPPGMQPARYERGPPPQDRHWNPQQQPQLADPSTGREDRKERKSKKKHKKEKKRHRREHERERRARRGGSGDMEPAMEAGPPSARRGHPSRRVNLLLPHSISPG